MTYIFRTATEIHLGTVYGIHTWRIQADSVQEAWDKVRGIVSADIALNRVKE